MKLPMFLHEVRQYRMSGLHVSTTLRYVSALLKTLRKIND